MRVEPKPNATDALGEIEQILREAASAATPRRLASVRYTLCRAALLDSEYRLSLPGFLNQCVSLHKFHDFITLYHFNPEARLSFLDHTFDVFSDPDF
jgi:hypothetical protein